MKMKRTMSMLVLAAALLVFVTAAAAETPAREAEIWSPVGDLVGRTDHATATFRVLDAYGSQAKALEDWQINSKYSGSLLFGVFHTRDKGNRFFFQGALDNSVDGKPAGSLTAGCNLPGHRKWTFDYRSFEHKYDNTSEMRAASFVIGPPPPALPLIPHFDWNRTRFTMGLRLADAFSLEGGLSRMNRNKFKSSLLRGAVGSAVPGLKEFDCNTDRIWARGRFTHGSLAAALDFGFRTADGNRTQPIAHTFADDQTTWNLGLDASYTLSGRTRIQGGGLVAKTTSSPREEYGGGVFLPDGEAKTTAGQLSLVTGIGSSSSLRLTGHFRQQDSSGRTDDENLVLAQAMTRDRSSQDYQARFVSTGLARTRIQLHYRYRSSDLAEVISRGDLPGNAADFHATDQDRTRQDAGLKLRYRFSRQVGFKGSLGWNRTEIDETNRSQGSGVDWLYRMGDRDVDRLGWQLALGLRPARGLKVDLGYRSADQTFERTGTEGGETTGDTRRGFITANWTASTRVSLLLSASLGKDKYELTDGPVSTGTMSPLLYDATTVRFAPGAIIQVSDKIGLEAIYEGIRFEDKGDAPDEANRLKSDFDRILLRAGYELGEKTRLTVSYRRQEFDENRWDDYILDIYSLSMSGKF